ALVRIRREHTDAKVAAFREIAYHLVGVPHLARQQRGEEFGGKMRLEIRGLVGHQRVGGGMRVVDDHAVRDEISVFFNSKVIRLLFPASVDGDNPIPEDVRRSDVLKTLTAKEGAQPRESRTIKPAFNSRSLSQKFLHGHTGPCFQFLPSQSPASALLIHPTSDFRRNRILTREPTSRRS